MSWRRETVLGAMTIFALASWAQQQRCCKSC